MNLASATEPEQTTILVDLGLPCDLECLDCPRREIQPHPMALEQAKRRLMAAARQVRGGTLRVAFYGGEVFRAAPELARLVRELRQACAARGALLEPVLISPGTSWTAEAARTLSAAGFRRVEVSLGGPREVHDRMKPLRGGGRSFDRILANLRTCRSGLDVVVRLGGADAAAAAALTAQLEAARLFEPPAPVRLLLGPAKSYRARVLELLALP